MMWARGVFADDGAELIIKPLKPIKYGKYCYDHAYEKEYIWAKHTIFAKKAR